MKNILASVAAGAISGLVGTFAMGQFQSLSSRVSQKQSDGGSSSEPATVKAAEAISENVFDRDLTESEKQQAGPAVDYAIGALIGAVYGVSATAMPISSAGRGMLYGGAVWLLADEFAVPALGLSGSPTKSPLSSHMNALSAHMVYGFTTDLVRRVFFHKAA